MTKEDIDTLNLIVNEYSEINNKIYHNENLLKKISAEQTDLLNRLEKNETKEKKFMIELHKKYPEITLSDLIKFII